MDPSVLAELLLFYLVHLTPTGGKLVRVRVFMNQAQFSFADPAVQSSESSFFSNSRGVDIQGGHFESHHGPSFHVTINTGSHPQEQTSAAAHGAGPSVAPAGGSDGHQDMRGHNKQSSYMNAARDNDSFTAMPLILPIQRPCDIYYRHLSVKGRGSPLWLPAVGRQLSIDYRRKGISIGDVGLITIFGSFDFLFNILLPAEHPIHGGRVPEGFIPLDPPLEVEDVDFQEEFAADSYLASASVKKAQNSGQGNSSALRFETTDSEGAILTIPMGSDSSNLLNLTRFRKYVDANVENWYCYANGKRGREAKNGDLRLITGWDKAKMWGMATFSRSSSTAQPPIQLDFKPLEQTGRTYKWEYSGIADGRTGPSIRESIDLRLPGEPEDVTFTNQCVFIRTINPLLSKNIWKRLEGTKFASLKSQDSRFFNSDDSEIMHSGKGKGKAVDPGSPMPGPGSFEHNSVVQSNDSATALPFHPSTAINDFLLNRNPNARIAITEDINWISVLTEDDYSLPPGNQILRRVMGRHEIGEENGIVFLRQLAKSNTSDYFDASQESIDTFENSSRSHNLRERANLLARNFDQGSLLNNFEDAILLYRQALQTIPSSDIDHRGIQSDLAEALLYRFCLFHQFDNLDEAIGLYFQDPEFQAPSHPIRFPEIYSNISNAIVRATYQQHETYADQSNYVFLALNCNVAGLEECILLQRLALELLPPSHPQRPSILDALAGTLIFQIFQLSTNQTDETESDEINTYIAGRKKSLDEAISFRRQSLELLSPCNLDARQLGILLGLAESLYLRYLSSDQLCDLDEAIHTHRQILDLLPLSHSVQPTILKCLAMELRYRYTQEKQPSDLDEAILLFNQYLRLPPPFRPDRPDILDALSDALFELRNTPQIDIAEDILLDLAEMSGRRYSELSDRRYSELSTAKDGSSYFLQLEHLVEKVIFFQRLAIEFLLPSNIKRVGILCDLAEMLLRKAEIVRKARHEHPNQQAESQQDDSRTEAVSLYRQALELTTLLHPLRYDTLDRFADLLFSLYQDEGELALLEEAILLAKQALELQSPLHPDYPEMLSGIAYAFACKYDEGGEMTDLYDSISFHKQALESCPIDLPSGRRFTLLGRLGDALACRFEVEGQMNDLEEAIMLNKQAIELPVPFPRIQKAFLDMQKLLARRTQHSKEVADFFNSDELKNIAATITSAFSSSNMDMKRIDSSLLFMLQNKYFAPHGDEQKAPQTLATASQPGIFKSSVAPSSGSQSAQGSIGVNPDNLSSQNQTDEKQYTILYKKDHEQSNLNNDTTPLTSSDLYTKAERFTERKRRMSSSTVVSD